MSSGDGRGSVLACFADIVAEVAAGEPIRRVLRDRNISARAFYSLIDGSAEHAERYARAKQAGMDAIADEIIDIADNLTTPSDQKRVMVDSRKWLLAKLAPKRYGDRLDLNHSGELNVSIASADADL